MEFTRRHFIGSSAAAVIAAGTMAKGKVFGANEKVRVCTIGFNGQGKSHIEAICERDDAEIVALCDVDTKVMERGLAMVEKATGKKPKAYTDVRDVMADKDIDAVTTATPNHWHALIAVWACQAGKDAYIEKPVAWSVYEGQQVVAAAEKSGRVVMHGTQSRSNARLIRDIKLMHEGFIGKIMHSRGYVYKNGNRYAIGHGKKANPPENLDWTLWQGPSPDHDYLETENGRGLQVPYNWHWFWQYGNGEIGNQGVHEMDIAVWGHNRGLPVKAYCTGGRYGWDDDAETPNTAATSFTYEDGSMLTFEVRNLGSFCEGNDKDCSNSFFGETGYYVRDAGFFDYKKREPIPVDDKPMPESGSKWDNWFKAIRTRKPEDNFAPPLASHLSCAHIHISNAAYRVGRELHFDPKTQTFGSDEEANKLLTREYRQGFEVPKLA